MTRLIPSSLPGSTGRSSTISSSFSCADMQSNKSENCLSRRDSYRQPNSRSDLALFHAQNFAKNMDEDQRPETFDSSQFVESSSQLLQFGFGVKNQPDAGTRTTTASTHESFAPTRANVEKPNSGKPTTCRLPATNNNGNIEFARDTPTELLLRQTGAGINSYESPLLVSAGQELRANPMFPRLVFPSESPKNKEKKKILDRLPKTQIVDASQPTNSLPFRGKARCASVDSSISSKKKENSLLWKDFKPQSMNSTPSNNDGKDERSSRGESCNLGNQFGLSIDPPSILKQRFASLQQNSRASSKRPITFSSPGGFSPNSDSILETATSLSYPGKPKNGVENSVDTKKINWNDGTCPRPNKTRSQLAVLQDKIAKFEGLLQMENKHRKSAGECKLKVLKETLETLEKTLAAEMRRRVDANKSTQMSLEDQLSALEERIDQAMEEKSKSVTSMVDAISTRLTKAEEEARQAMEIQKRQLVQLAEDIDAVASEAQKIKDYISDEFQARRQRGEIISDKLVELEKQIESKVNIEKSVRERDVRKLEGAVEELRNYHIAADDSFQQDLVEKFLELKQALKEETQAREQADDDIVQALNYYTIAYCKILNIPY